jgi:hypothetical protein
MAMLCVAALLLPAATQLLLTRELSGHQRASPVPMVRIKWLEQHSIGSKVSRRARVWL